MFLIKNKKSAKWNDILKIYYIAYYKWFFSYKLLNSLIQGGSLKKLAQIVFMVRLSFLSQRFWLPTERTLSSRPMRVRFELLWQNRSPYHKQCKREELEQKPQKAATYYNKQRYAGWMFKSLRTLQMSTPKIDCFGFSLSFLEFGKLKEKKKKIEIFQSVQRFNQ